MVIESHSAEETQKLAGDIVRKIVEAPERSGATVIALEGELGAGKTTFAKSFAEALGIEERVSSPTFILMSQYNISGKAHFKKLIHIDSYRLNDWQEMLPLGVKELIADPGNILLIEWSDRVKEILPADCITIHIDHISEKERRVSVSNL